MMKMPVLLAILMWSGIAAASDDAVVAELYGQKITAADLPLPPKMVEESRSTMSPDEFAQWRQDSLRQMLAYGVMQEAQKRFLTEMKLEPTDAEIDSYMESQRRFMAADRKRRAAEQEKLEQELGQADLSEERRSELQGNLTSLNWLAEQEKPPATDAERKEQREAERSVAAMMVATWKFNQGLYHKYGGRVVFQQAGNEPLDANKAFIEELKTSDAYTIIDPAYQDLFKETDEYFAKHFDYLDQAEADAYFSAPWWLKENTK